RLVIGVASDFARLRLRTSSTDVAKARTENVKPSAQASATALPVIASNVAAVAPATAETNLLPAASYTANNLSSNDETAPPISVASAPTVFRRRTIWTRFPSRSFQFSRAYAA